MSTANTSKRNFFKKLAASVGFFSAASYVGKLISAPADAVDRINENCANDVNKQKNVLAQARLVLMTDQEKKQMLDDIFDGYKQI